VARRLTPILVLLFVAGLTGAAQQPVADVGASIARLGAFDYEVRTAAARAIRRSPSPQAVPALAEAVRSHKDEFVRYRALVLLTAFNDRGTPDLLRGLLRDRNDRVREVAYRWFADRPESTLTSTLLAALQTEQAEFVRPALVSALAALGSDPQVQRALVTEAGRGLDFFRIAVVDALGQRRATYAADAVAAFAKLDGPLQDDAVLALARMGDQRALTVVGAGESGGPDVRAAVHAASCLLGQDCDGHRAALAEAALAPGASADVVRASVTGLAAVALKPDSHAIGTLVLLGRTLPAGIRELPAVVLSTVALRDPGGMLAWLDAAVDETRETAVGMLRVGFERLEEDFAEEQFFAAARAAYWLAADGSPARTRLAALIDTLRF
jgi:hypothetical protein